MSLEHDDSTELLLASLLQIDRPAVVEYEESIGWNAGTCAWKRSTGRGRRTSLHRVRYQAIICKYDDYIEGRYLSQMISAGLLHTVGSVQMIRTSSR